MKTLRDHWDLTCEQWDDHVSRDFDKNHMNPLEQQVEHALRGMDKLAEILTKVRNECS